MIKSRKLSKGDKVIIPKLGAFGVVRFCHRVNGRAMIDVRLSDSGMDVSVSPLELVRWEEVRNDATAD